MAVLVAGLRLAHERFVVFRPEGGDHDEGSVCVEAAQQCGGRGLSFRAREMVLSLVQPEDGARAQRVGGERLGQVRRIGGKTELEVAGHRLLYGFEGAAGLACAGLRVLPVQDRPRTTTSAGCAWPVAASAR